MLKKTLFIISLLFVLVATPVLANQSKNNEHNTSGDCGESPENHGAFVSCVAKTHEGGAVVSAAARSDIGRQEDDRDDDRDEDEDDDDRGGGNIQGKFKFVFNGQTIMFSSPSPSASTSPTPSASPGASPQVSPSPQASPSSSPSPTVSPSPTIVSVQAKAEGPIDQVIAFFEQILGFLKNLVPSAPNPSPSPSASPSASPSPVASPSPSP